MQTQKNLSINEEIKTYFSPMLTGTKLKRNHKISYNEITKRMMKDQ